MGFKVVKQKGTLVFLDLEGASAESSERISQIAAMAFSIADFGHSENGIPFGANFFCKMINPEKADMEKARQITGFTDDRLRCQSFKEMFPELQQFLTPLAQPIYLVAHSGAAFDFPTLHDEVKKTPWKQLGLKLVTFDTFQLFENHGMRRKDPKWTNGLRNIYGRLHRARNRRFDVKDCHVAVEDVQILAHICKKVQRLFIKAAKRETPILW